MSVQDLTADMLTRIRNAVRNRDARDLLRREYHPRAASLGLPTAVAIIGAVVLGLAFAALFFWRETFGRSLAFEEE